MIQEQTGKIPGKGASYVEERIHDPGGQRHPIQTAELHRHQDGQQRSESVTHG